ncbi:cytochrome c oxidase subunit 2A [Sphingobacterium luzhongxinii]
MNVLVRFISVFWCVTFWLLMQTFV